MDIRDKTDNIDNQDKRHELQRGEDWIREAIKSGQRVRGGGNWSGSKVARLCHWLGLVSGIRNSCLINGGGYKSRSGSNPSHSYQYLYRAGQGVGVSRKPDKTDTGV